MTPLSLSPTWQRRFLGGMLVFALASLLVNLLISGSIIASALGALSAVVAAAGLSAKLKDPYNFPVRIASYGLLAGSVFFALVHTSPQLDGGFLAAWALLSLVGAILGIYGWLGSVVLTGVLAAIIYLAGGLHLETALTIVLAGIVPALAGLFIWKDNADAPSDASKNAKHLASELSEVASKSEIIINAIGDGVMAIDSRGVIELINPAAQEILGWGKQDALQLNYKSILQLQDENNHELDASQDPVQQVLNTNQQTRGNKLSAITQSGKRINLSLVVSPIGAAGAGVIAVFRDVTKEKAEEHEQAEFISTASHEMRTPVASIEGYLGLTLNPQTATIDARAQSYIQKAHEAAQHLGRLFQDLLDVSKSEDGRMTNIPRVVNLTALTEAITQGLQQKAQAKGLQLTFKPGENGGQRKIMPVVYVNQDNDHIQEVLDNLIENAIKYTLQGGVIVDIQSTDDHVTISVSDSGLGIPPEDLPHLFQKFYRVDNIDRQQIGGTGLGLYLSRRLAESMQGRLWVESTYGQGSTFFFELPRISNLEAEQLMAQQATQQALAPQSIPAATPAAAPFTPETSPAPAPAEAVPAPATAAPTEVKPATTVPRGESLTREQIAERVRQLEEMARAQRETPPTR